MKKLYMLGDSGTMFYVKQLITTLLITVLILPFHVLPASTQAGELVVVKVDPQSGEMIASIEFMEYFSAPGEFQPGMHWKIQIIPSQNARCG